RDGGRSQSTQWTHVPRGASGSSQTSVRLRAAAGTPDQESGGEASRPSPECSRGMSVPSAKAALSSRIVLLLRRHGFGHAHRPPALLLLFPVLLGALAVLGGQG